MTLDYQPPFIHTLDKTTVLQTLLDAEAQIGNSSYMSPEHAKKQLIDTRSMIVRQIEAMRGIMPPDCYGLDDCSTAILCRCPWRMTCGDDNA